MPNNENQNLKRLLDSLVSQTTSQERNKVEVLIKKDSDDISFPHPSFSAAYPFPVFIYTGERAEGRNSLHHFYDYLLGRINRNSKYILIVSDDFVFNRTGFVTEILNINQEFCMIETADVPTNIVKYVGRWRDPEVQRQWRCQTNMAAPCFSTRLIEVTSGFGFIPDVDCWAMLLSIILMESYGVSIRKNILPFYERLDCKPAINCATASFLDNKNLDYWHELTRRQAKNIYLNLVYGKSIK